ncbi:MAG TPA: HD domain-containing protein [Candidatus Eremiobacteraceae bacterium]
MEHSRHDLDDLLSRLLPKAGLYAVGGRVRDELLTENGFQRQESHNQPPIPDYLVTGISMDDLVHSLRSAGSAELVGASFGVVKFAAGNVAADIALPRRERSTGTHHRDFAVDYDPSISIEDDLARRDFRMNMMARDIRSGTLIDPYGGRADIEAKRLDILADQVFVEDPLRILRGAQFAARFDLTLSARTASAMREAAHLVSTVAAERVADELTKLLTLAAKPSTGFEILRDSGALDVLLPEVMEGWGVEQNEYHKYSIYFHSMKCLDSIAPRLRLRLAALFHDVGKPRTKDGPHFYRHEMVGEAMTKEALERLRFPFDLVRDVAHLVRHHMFAADDQLTDAAVRRFVRRVGVGAVEPLFALRAADVVASGLPPRDPAQALRFETRVREAIAARTPFGIADLAIDGGDIIAIMRELKIVAPEFTGDRRVGDALNHCLEQVLDDPALNERASLRALVRAFFAAPQTPAAP